MRSRDLINGFDYGEYMQNQMFCFGSSDGGGGSDGGPPGGGFSSDRADPGPSAANGGPPGGGFSSDRADPGPSRGPSGISPGLSQAALGTPAYAGASSLAAAAANAAASDNAKDRAAAARLAANDPSVAGYMSDVAALQNLNRQLENLSRREAVAQSRLRSPLSLIPGFGLANYLGLQNVRNLASASIGSPSGLLGSFGLGERVSPDFMGLSPSRLAGLQSQAITDDEGNIVGFRDEAGNVRYGTDPNAPDTFGDGPDTVPAEYNPVTGQQDQCPEGYVFDEDLQACRMGGGTPSFGQPVSGAGPYPAGDYARMGLLDVAPMGMGMFADRYGAGFGTPQDFNTANLAFRRGAATRPQYFQQAPDLTGYTLLS